MQKKTTKILFLFFSFLTINSLLFSQAVGCDGTRYYHDIFNDVVKTTVQYGENFSIQGVHVDLFMDIYEPAGDVLEKRPVVILAFGGSFVSGDRDDMKENCLLFAKKGYVAATIDYRLYPLEEIDFPVDSLEALDEVIKAVGDMKAAVRYFRQDAATNNLFKIDSNYIFIGGGSSGAIISLHAGLMEMSDDLPDYILDAIENNGGIEGNSGDIINLTYSSDVQAILNFSGALHRKEMIDSDDPPFVSYHGTEDNVVPFNFGNAGINGTGLTIDIFTVDGSGSLKARADEVDVDNYLVAVEGGMHSDIYDPEFSEYLDEFTLGANLFLHNILCPGTDVIPLGVNDDVAENINVLTYPNPSDERMVIELSDEINNYDLSIYDQLGRQVNFLANQNKNQIILSKNKIGKGIFFLKIQQNNSKFSPIVKRIVFE